MTATVGGLPVAPQRADGVFVRRALLTLRVFDQMPRQQQGEWLRRHFRRARANGMPADVEATLGLVLAYSAGLRDEGAVPAGTGAAPSDPAAHDGHGAARERSARGVGADSVRRL